jgi:hypothetical protein
VVAQERWFNGCTTRYLTVDEAHPSIPAPSGALEEGVVLASSTDAFNGTQADDLFVENLVDPFK